MLKRQSYADKILEYRMDPDTLSTVSSDILLNIESLWHDPVIPSVMDRSSEFYLMDSATYFFANIPKIMAPDYVPDEADVLRARTKTTGISETRFNMGQLSIHMFDVGGQRSERKKWIHCMLLPASVWRTDAVPPSWHVKDCTNEQASKRSPVSFSVSR